MKYCARFRSHGSDLHSLLHGVSEKVLEEPLARLTEAGFAALFKNLKVKLSLLERWLR